MSSRNKFTIPNAIPAMEIAQRFGMKPDLCPFCQSGALGFVQSGKHHHVACFCCGADGPIKEHPFEAIAAWNNREDKRDLNMISFDEPERRR